MGTTTGGRFMTRLEARAIIHAAMRAHSTFNHTAQGDGYVFYQDARPVAEALTAFLGQKILINPGMTRISGVIDQVAGGTPDRYDGPLSATALWRFRDQIRDAVDCFAPRYLAKVPQKYREDLERIQRLLSEEGQANMDEDWPT